MKLILSAAIVSLAAMSAASAQPPLAPISGATQSDVIQVQRRDRDDNARGGRDDDRKFTPGRRYRDAPPGWRRHGHRRPGDWRTRGCIMAGPLWFCP